MRTENVAWPPVYRFNIILTDWYNAMETNVLSITCKIISVNPL